MYNTLVLTAVFLSLLAPSPLGATTVGWTISQGYTATPGGYTKIYSSATDVLPVTGNVIGYFPLQSYNTTPVTDLTEEYFIPQSTSRPGVLAGKVTAGAFVTAGPPSAGAGADASENIQWFDTYSVAWGTKPAGTLVPILMTATLHSEIGTFGTYEFTQAEALFGFFPGVVSTDGHGALQISSYTNPELGANPPGYGPPTDKTQTLSGVFLVPTLTSLSLEEELTLIVHADVLGVGGSTSYADASNTAWVQFQPLVSGVTMTTASGYGYGPLSDITPSPEPSSALLVGCILGAAFIYRCKLKRSSSSKKFSKQPWQQ